MRLITCRQILRQLDLYVKGVRGGASTSLIVRLAAELGHQYDETRLGGALQAMMEQLAFTKGSVGANYMSKTYGKVSRPVI